MKKNYTEIRNVNMIKQKGINKIKKINTLLLIILIVLQPILDTFYLYTDEVVNLLGFSPATIIRVLLVGVLFLFAFFTSKWEKKWIALYGYGSIIFIYTFFHHLHCNKFTELVHNNVQYSFFMDVFYIIQLILPLLVLFITYNSELNKKIFAKVIFTLVITISGSIVLSNLMKMSLGSYNNEIIKGSIIDWFTKGYVNYSYYDYASKGFFYFANRVSTVLIMLLPVNFYCVSKNVSYKTIGILLLHVVSMLMLGTKVATLGGTMIFVLMSIVYLFFVFVKKEIKKDWTMILSFIFIIVLCVVVIPKSPAIYREIIATNVEKVYGNERTESNITETPTSTVKNNDKKSDKGKDKKSEIADNNSSDNKDKRINEEEREKQDKIKYIRENYKDFSINETFILNSYPYEEDPDFWLSIFDEPIGNRLNYRYMEIRMVQRVKDLNNNNGDNWFGIGYSRVQNIYNIERDFVLQYYSLGIFGVIILLGPIVGIIAICGFYCLIKFKRYFTMENVSLLAGGGITVIISWYSGNSLDSLFVSIIMAFLLGKLLYNLFYNKIESNDI